MQIEKIDGGTQMIISLPWRLDASNSPELEAVIKRSLDGVKVLTMDMRSVEYISSAGLRVLVSAQKIMNKQGKMKVTHVNSTLMEILKVTGFSEILHIV